MYISFYATISLEVKFILQIYLYTYEMTCLPGIHCSIIYKSIWLETT